MTISAIRGLGAASSISSFDNDPSIECLEGRLLVYPKVPPLQFSVCLTPNVVKDRLGIVGLNLAVTGDVSIQTHFHGRLPELSRK